MDAYKEDQNTYNFKMFALLFLFLIVAAVVIFFILLEQDIIQFIDEEHEMIDELHTVCDSNEDCVDNRRCIVHDDGYSYCDPRIN